MSQIYPKTPVKLNSSNPHQYVIPHHTPTGLRNNSFGTPTRLHTLVNQNLIVSIKASKHDFVSTIIQTGFGLDWGKGAEKSIKSPHD